MLLTVVIPCYNNVSTIGGMLLTLLCHGRPDQTEVVVVDDGSTDHLQEYIASLTQNLRQRYGTLSKLTVLRCEHRGASAARNEGMRAAQGRYLWFVDADDILYPKSIEHLIQWIEGLDHHTSLLKMGSMLLNNCHEDCIPDKAATRRVPIAQILTRKQGALDHTTYLYLREFLIANNIHYPEHHRVLEDSTFTLRCIALTEVVEWNPTYRFYNYFEPRSSRGPWTREQQKERIADIEAFFHSFWEIASVSSDEKHSALTSLYDYYLYLHLRILTVKGYPWKELKAFRHHIPSDKHLYSGNATMHMKMMRNPITYRLFHLLCFTILNTPLRYVVRSKR